MVWRQAFEANLWRAPGKAAWCFVTLPEDIATRVRNLAQGLRNPFARFASLHGLDQPNGRHLCSRTPRPSHIFCR